MRKPIQKRILIYLYIYFSIIHFVPLVNMIFLKTVFKPSIFINIFSLYSVILTFIFVYTRSFNETDFAVFAYLLISVFSIFLYKQTNHPSSYIAYFYSIQYSVIPICLYFTLRFLEEGFQKKILKYIIYLNIFLIFVSLLLFYFRPEFYYIYLAEMLGSVGVSGSRIFYRLNSYFGSRIIGIIASISIILITFYKFKLPVEILFVALMTTAIWLSQQRGSFIIGFMAVSYFMLHKKLSIKKIVGILLLLILTIIICNNIINKYKYISYYTQNRYEALNVALIERWQSNYIRGWNLFLQFPLGLGLGATGYHASRVGMTETVPDANFIRILADLGFLGIVNIMLIIIFSIKSALKKNDKWPYLLIIMSFCIIALGTNVFDTIYVAHVFWSLLGIINTNVKKKWVGSFINAELGSKQRDKKLVIYSHANKEPPDKVYRNF